MGCFGDWSVTLFEGEQMYYQVKCICECHIGQPTGMDALLSWYKENPNELKAVKKLMPTFGDKFEDMVNEHGEEIA
jgi:hypothetical protein